MRTKFNRALVALVVVTSLAFAGFSEAKAQSHDLTTMVSGGTNNVAATATNTYGTITVTKGSKLGVQINFKMTAAGATSNAFFYLDKNIDAGTNWDTSGEIITAAANGTTLVSKTVSVTADGVAYYRLRVGNSNSIPITNLTVKTGVKTGW